MNTSFGKLYLIPTRLGDNPPLEVLPISVKKIIERVDDYIVENEKTARRFIKKVDSRKQQSILKFEILNKYTKPEELLHFLDACIVQTESLLHVHLLRYLLLEHQDLVQYVDTIHT